MESKNIKGVVLIPFCFAHATRAGGSPRETRAIRAGGRAAFAIQGAAYPISLPGR